MAERGLLLKSTIDERERRSRGGAQRLRAFDPLALPGTVHRLPQIAAPLHVEPEVGLLPNTRARISAVAAVTLRPLLHSLLTCLR